MTGDRYGVPERIGGAVASEVARLGGSDRTLELTRRWEDAVGPTVAGNAWPARLARDGTLVVHTSSSVWAHELTQMAEMIRERLGELAPARIRFLAGALPSRPDPPSPAPPLSRPDEQSLAIARELSAPIESPGLREAVAGAIAAALSRDGAGRPV